MKRLVLVCLFFTFSALAQQPTYRWSDPKTGRTTISDEPPTAGIKYTEEKKSAGKPQEKPLSYATQQAAAKFPVILYLFPDCEVSCERAYELLSQRGIPFEKVVFQSNDETAGLKQELGEKFLIPAVRVGRQLLGGFNAAEWNNTFDLAGYPKSKSGY